MFEVIRTLILFLLARTTKNWRTHRSACMNLLPKAEKRDAEGGA